MTLVMDLVTDHEAARRGPFVLGPFQAARLPGKCEFPQPVARFGPQRFSLP
jgi:hypothetical protein